MESKSTVLETVKDKTEKEEHGSADQQEITSSESKAGNVTEISKSKMDNDKKESPEKSNNSTDKKKNEKVGKENEKNTSDKDDDESESEDEIEMGLLDRPVEVTGCRARKQVQRLEVSFVVPTKDKQIPEGRGTKLGDCPRIEFQIAKHLVADLKPLHRILFNRQGTATDTKKNIRKFSGFPFEENSSEFEKNKARCEKLSLQTLKKICELLDLDRSGTKDDIISRILLFLVCPSDSGKALPPKKKSAGRDKKTPAKKKGKKSNIKKSKTKSSEEEEYDDDDDEIAPSEGEEASDASANEEEEEISTAAKKKSKAKSKKTLIKVKTMKDEPKKEAKGLKRKKDASEEVSSEEDDEPITKKCKLPEDDEIKNLVQTILEKADLTEVTMKKVIKQVYDTYPDCDLTGKKSLIKKTIKTVLQLNEKEENR